MVKELSDGVTETQLLQKLWKLSYSMIMVWERYCYASPKPEFFSIFFVYIFIRISANMRPFGLKFSQMILYTDTSKRMYNWSFLFVVLHKPTLLPSTFKCKYFKHVSRILFIVPKPWRRHFLWLISLNIYAFSAGLVYIRILLSHSFILIMLWFVVHVI